MKGTIITGGQGSGKSTLAKGIMSRYKKPLLVDGREKMHHFTFKSADLDTDVIVIECTKKYIQPYLLLTDYGVRVEKMMEDPFKIHPDIVIILDDQASIPKDVYVPRGYEIYKLNRTHSNKCITNNKLLL
jgi:broad-specificity NMP kinase